MPSIVGKRQGGKTYFYLVESARVDGKARIVSQQYLGPADEVIAKLTGAPAGAPVRSQHKRFGDVAAHFRSAEVTRGGTAVDLSAREYRLLQYLVEHRGAIVSREELLKEVWGYDSMPLTRTVDVHVAWLRQKLEPNARRPTYIQTVHGLGYKFVAGQ